YSGQLGDGTTGGCHFSPVQVGTATWKTISAGLFGHTCAIRSDDSLWCWGSNVYGQLGDGTTTNHASPVQVGSATWNTVGAGGSHSCGIRSNGTLWCWGDNSSGQLGDGTTTNRSSPVQVGNLTEWQSVDAGTYHTHA